MKLVSLTLTGFCGIRDGLGRDSVSIDLEAIAGDAKLVALAGANGRGKSTLLDNMTPYPVMFSRAGGDGLGSFSYYDNVYLPENHKILVWERDQTRYRTHVVIRLNGKRKTEAFLHVESAGRWIPVRLRDGTVSDGKVDTYVRCVESIMGSVETFCTTSFSAQSRRQLCAYKNAEIKSLLGDLLGLDRIRMHGEQAAEVVRMVRTGLLAVRQEKASVERELERVTGQIDSLEDSARRVEETSRNREVAASRLALARDALATAMAEEEASHKHEEQRARILENRAALIDHGKAILGDLDAQHEREVERMLQLDRRIRQRLGAHAAYRASLDERRGRLHSQIACRSQVMRAARRSPVLSDIIGQRERRVNVARDLVAKFDKLQSDRRLHLERIANLEREAGQAALREKDLTSRLELTGLVPCAGTGLQERCGLLEEARSAKSLMPSAAYEVQRIHRERGELANELRAIEGGLMQLSHAPTELRNAEARLRRVRARALRESELAGRAQEIANALEELAAVNEKLDAASFNEAGETQEEADERDVIRARQSAILSKREEETTRQQHALARIDESIRQLPPVFDFTVIGRARTEVLEAQRLATDTDEQFLISSRDWTRLGDARGRRQQLADQIGTLEQRIALIETCAGDWALFAKCMSKDGLIALAIDDAGPELSSITNDLLLSCYGPRFTVSIKTQVETVKGEVREGFDIVVLDSARGSSKSVTAMSGGERVWINECLTRGMALYLAGRSGRRSDTLFSDEADGAFDAGHKRMFMDMKREILRIGGYKQEFFISHTPALTAMADAVIDLDEMVLTAIAG